MKRTASVLFVVTLALVAWRVLVQGRDGRGDRAAPAIEEPPEAAPISPELRAVELAPLHSAGNTLDSARRRESSGVPARLVAGTVTFPRELYAREEAYLNVTLHAEQGGASLGVRTTGLAPDGSFSLLVPGEVRFARLDLDARFLRLLQPVEVRPGDTGIVLRPEVCGVIEGVVVAPSSLSPLGVGWSSMRVWLQPRGLRGDGGRGTDPARAHRLATGGEVIPDDDGTFQFKLLPPGVAFELSVESAFGPYWEQLVAPLEPGELRRIRVELEQGITVSGRVVDELGSGVKGVTVWADDGASVTGHRQHGLTQSDSDGRFSLDHLPRCTARIFPLAMEFARSAAVTIDASAGDVHGIVLEVVRGGTIEGRVTWPDGTEVESGEVVASGSAYRNGKVRGGRFRIEGLGHDVFSIEIDAARGGRVGRVVEREARVGGPPLDLVLVEQEALELHGVVVDASHGAVRGAFIHLGSEDSAATHFARSGERGEFALPNVAPGEYSLMVTAEGYPPVELSTVLAPGTGPLRIVLVQGGHARGRVLDPSGGPVEGAWVGDESVATNASHVLGASDAAGGFEVALVAARPRLVALKRGYAASEAVELAVGPNEVVEGLVLVLRPSCSLEGRVLDDRGRPLAGAEIAARCQPSLMATSAADGSFSLAALPPGPLELVATHDERPSWFVSTTVTLGPVSSTVELRFARAEPVRLRGRVTRAGIPCEVRLFFRGQGQTCGATSDADGRFELTLGSPGRWEGLLWPTSQPIDPRDPTGVDLRHFELAVPNGDEHTCDLGVETLRRVTTSNELERIVWLW